MCNRRLMSAARCRTVLLGLVLGIAVAPLALASSEDDKNLERFFEPLPPEVLAEFAPNYQRGSVEGKYGSSVTAEGASVQQKASVQEEFDPLPIERVTPIITGVSDLGGLPTFEFRVVDQFGFGVEGFRQDENVDFRFTVNKLLPGRNGNLDTWRTYIRAADEGIERISTSAYRDGTLEDLGDGNYRFTFDQPLEAISNVPYQPQFTHRVGMEVRDPAPFGEEVRGSDTAFDILPSTGQTEEDGIPTKNVVAQENCTVCHGEETFAFHGGPRQSVKQCVSCHQPNARDAFSGNSLDLGIMIHKIHNAQNLTQLPYQFCGFGCENFGAPPDDFSHVGYPQSVKNCTVCHNPANPATPEAANIDSKATAANCASCHDDLAFDANGLTNANGNHIGLAQPNETCEACHAPDGLLQGNLAYHVIPSQVAALNYSYNIVDVSNTAEGQSPMITFSVTNTETGEALDLATAPEFTGSGARLQVALAWPNTDFTNVGNDGGTTTSGRPVGQPIGIDVLPVEEGVLQPYIIDNGDGTYTVDTMGLSSPLVVPSTNPPLGSGTAMIEGHIAGDYDGDGDFSDEVPVQNATQSFAINDASPVSRRTVVSLAKCQDCHNVRDGLAFHGNNRTDNIEGCTTCHTPNATDLYRRPVDPDGIANGVNEATLDGREDQTVSMGYMIHAIHAASVREEEYVAYGFGNTPHPYGDASYSRSPAECQACHEGDSYTLPLASERLATTTESGATVLVTSDFGPRTFEPGDGSASDPTDDNNVSAETAACVACHNSDEAIDHMAARSDSSIAFGNGWVANPLPISDPDTQAFIDQAEPENCAFCHSEGSFVPVSEVHLID